MDKWIEVECHTAEILPKEDCEIYITRVSSLGDRWVQKIRYYTEEGIINWDGTIGWMPLQEKEPDPYKRSWERNQPRKEIIMSKKKQFMELFEDAMHSQYCYFIAVAIENSGNEGIEIIVNPPCNFESKMKYYQDAYDDDLVLKSFHGIRIVGACSFGEEVEWSEVLKMLNEIWNE